MCVYVCACVNRPYCFTQWCKVIKSNAYVYDMAIFEVIRAVNLTVEVFYCFVVG